MKDPRFAKLVVFVNSAVPLAVLAWDWTQNQLGPDPVNYAEHTTGTLALIFLMLSLSVTPLRKISGWNWFSHFRRMLGLFAFFYASVHFSIYFISERSLNVWSVVQDTFQRRFIFFGMLGLAAMIPLAITSTNGMIKRLGALKWKRLHRLAYVAAIAGVVHYWMLVKRDETKPGIFAAVLFVLLGFRFVIAGGKTPKSPEVARTGAKSGAV
jgi:DMSO/TMAO reductase YedYZ heme-binding membrane subunit